MAETPRLKLPLLDAAQAQKHVTHNEAILQLDLLTGLIPVLDRDLAAPPAASDGAVYILAAAGTGAWTGFSAGDLALRIDGGWRRVLPSAGMTAVIIDEGGAQVYWSGAAWLPIGASRGLVKKVTTTERPNSTTPAADPELQVYLGANTTYVLSLKVFFGAPVASGFKHSMTGPASPVYCQVERRTRAPNTTSESYAAQLGYPGTTIVNGNATNEFGYMFAEVLVETGATAGVFSFVWSQNVLGAAPTIVRAGSTLEWLVIK